MRIEQIGDCILYLGDCLEVIPTVARVDAVVTDIPYEISQKSNGLRRLDYGGWDGAGATDVGLSALKMVTNVGSIIAWCGWKQLGHIKDLFSDRSERPLTWNKPNPPVLNGQRLFLSSSEFAYYGKLPGAWFGGNCIKSYWLGSPPQDRQHPTQKPAKLMKWCVLNTVAPNAICLDPFMGSGTTLVACAKLGRSGIGIELEEKYFDIACERIQKAYDQPDLFIEEQRKPEQLGML